MAFEQSLFIFIVTAILVLKQLTADKSNDKENMNSCCHDGALSLSPQRYTSSPVKHTNTKATRQVPISSMWMAVDPSDHSWYTATWQVAYKHIKTHTHALSSCHDFCLPVLPKERHFQGEFSSHIQTQGMFSVFSLLLLYQRTKRGWWSSTIIQSWPRFDHHQAKIITQLTLNTHLKRSSWRPLLANQSTASRSWPTTAGSHASSVHQVRLVDNLSHQKDWDQARCRYCLGKFPM